MLIKTLDLRNFQKHKNLSLKFSRYLTAIKGTSGVGKSAILRSLFQLVDESIPWSACCTWDTNDTSIKIQGKVDDRLCVIERLRSSDVNSVIIDGVSYDYIGKNTPDILIRKLNIKAHNIQKQKDFWFLIDMKPGQLSKELNSVSGLNIIDASIQEISSRVRNAQAEIRVLKAQAIVLEKEIQALEYIHKADVDLASLEKAEERLKQSKSDVYILKEKAEEYRRYKSQQKESPAFLEKALDELISLWYTMSDLKAKYKELKALYDTFSDLKSRCTDCTGLEEHFKILSTAYDCLVSVRKHNERLQQLSYTYRQYADELSLKKIKLKEQEELLSEIQSRIKICPVCNRPM